MNPPETYDYPVRARRDLRSALEGVPDEVLSRPLLNGWRLHCIKDLVAHEPTVEDFWRHEDILHQPPVRETIPAVQGADWGPHLWKFRPQNPAGLRARCRGEHARLPRRADRRRVETDWDGRRRARGAVHGGWRVVARDDSRDATHGTDGRAAAHARHRTALAGSEKLTAVRLRLIRSCAFPDGALLSIVQTQVSKPAAQGKFVTFGVTRGFIAVASPVSSMTWLMAP